MALVAIAGPAVNFTLAALAALALRAGGGMPGASGAVVQFLAGTTIGINCALGVLNLLPILPLDGGRIVTALLPQSIARSYARLERVGLLLLVVLLTQTSLLTTLVRPVIHAFVAIGVPGFAGPR
jgi:Zn-dependent protease